ncbi:MAG: ROK family protein [Bacteroidetes bacterium]|nr:MAG: ROK family protein [Bacteroidota bacterium]
MATLKNKLIGVDLGGTKVEAGLIEGMEVIDKKYSLIPADSKNASDIIDVIINIISELFDQSVKGIGIGIPSLVDRKNGIVYEVQNIPSWQKVPLANILKDKFKVPVYLDNDANCFALGEYRYGAGKNHKNFVGLTLGTGMGAGIITDGHLLKDANCGSGEFGSIPYLDSIYEDYCSGKFFRTFYNEDGQNLVEKAKSGDTDAIKAFNEFGNHLGNAIKTIMFSVDPHKIIIGGSVAKSKEAYTAALLKSVEKFPYPESVKNLEIIYTDTANIAVLGAASLYYDRHE